VLTYKQGFRALQQSIFGADAIVTVNGEQVHGKVLFLKGDDPVLRLQVPQRDPKTNAITGYNEVISTIPGSKARLILPPTP
jgi:hypothetical protein